MQDQVSGAEFVSRTSGQLRNQDTTRKRAPRFGSTDQQEKAPAHGRRGFPNEVGPDQ